MRLNPNDAYVSTYYFWWTNLTYLPLFFFTILLITHYASYAVRKAPQAALVPVLLALYSTELLDHLPLNVCDASSVYGSYGANTLLTNTLNRYHPLVFYTSTLTLTSTLLLFSLRVYSRARFARSLGLRSYLGSLWQSTKVNLIALWMGSWWALQEGTWGGWWNWDPSETFGLLVTFSALVITHNAATYLSVRNLFTKLLIMWLLVLVSYFFIQLNFDLVSHNFGSKFFFFFNNNLFFLESLLALTTVLFTWSYSTWARSVTSSIYIPTQPNLLHNNGIVLRITPLFIACYWVFWSYRPLVNYFLWNFLGVNVFNFETSLQPIHLMGSTILLMWLYSAHPYAQTAIIIYNFMTLNWLWTFILVLLLSSRISILHSLVPLLTLLNSTLFGTDLIFWVFSTEYDYRVLGSSIELSSFFTLSPDSSAWESVHAHNTPSSRNSNEWNLFTISNAPAVNYFSLPLTQSFLSNFYSLGSLYVSPTLHLELPALASVNVLFWLVISLLHYSTPLCVTRNPL